MDEWDASMDEHRRTMIDLEQQAAQQAARLAAQQADPSIRTLAAGDWGAAQEWAHEQQQNALEQDREHVYQEAQQRAREG
jgi:hypothetical protein